MSAKSRSGGLESASDQKGPRTGPGYVLAEIDPATLPDADEDVWAEVHRRLAAYREGRQGWRTGEIQGDLSEWGGEEA